MRIYVDVDARESLRRGVEPVSVLDLDPATLAPEDRDLVARHLVQRDGRWEVCDARRCTVTLPAATPEALLEALRAVEVREAEEAAERERAIQAALAAPLAHWIASGWPPHVEVEPWSVSLDPPARRDPRILARRKEAEREALPAAVAEYKRRQAQDRARRRAEARQAEARQQALRDWAIAHDERSRLLVEENHPGWLKVAEAAWHTAFTPQWWETLPDAEVSERTKPTADDVYALRGARQLAASSAGALADPRLAWVVEYQHDPDNPDADDDGDVVSCRTAAVLMDVVAPTGARRTVWAPAGSDAYRALVRAGRQSSASAS